VLPSTSSAWLRMGSSDSVNGRRDSREYPPTSPARSIAALKYLDQLGIEVQPCERQHSLIEGLSLRETSGLNEVVQQNAFGSGHVGDTGDPSGRARAEFLQSEVVSADEDLEVGVGRCDEGGNVARFSDAPHRSRRGCCRPSAEDRKPCRSRRRPSDFVKPAVVVQGRQHHECVRAGVARDQGVLGPGVEIDKAMLGSPFASFTLNGQIPSVDTSTAALLPDDLRSRFVHRGGRRAFIAQPSVAEQIRRLESEVGVRLFVRTGRRLELTEAGSTVRMHAERFMAAMEAAEASLQGARQLRGGTASLATFDVAQRYLVSDLVTNFVSRHPDVTVRVIGQHSSEVIEQVRNGELEAGLVTLPVDAPTLAVEPVLADEVLFLSSPGPDTQ
jgi:hypothetical protein